MGISLLLVIGNSILHGIMNKLIYSKDFKFHGLTV